MIPEVADEVDRQLGDQRAAAESLATRSGLMVAATAALLGIAATRDAAAPMSPTGFWIIGGALLVGVVVFWMGRVGLGPSPSTVALAPDAATLTHAKLILIEANNRTLARTQAAFAFQVFLTLTGLFVLVFNLWPTP
jgi:hypothetical protein